MKIGIISDTHLGIPQSPFFLENLKNYLRALELLKKQNVDLIIHAGDIFDRQVPSFDIAHKILETVPINIPMFYVQGNHDQMRTFENNPALNIVKEHYDLVGTYNNGIRIYDIEDVRIIGIDYIKESLFEAQLKKASQYKTPNTLLIIHQYITPYFQPDEIPCKEQGFPIEKVRSYGFQYIVNGHLHRPIKDGNTIVVGGTSYTRFESIHFIEREWVEKKVWTWDNGFQDITLETTPTQILVGDFNNIYIYIYIWIELLIGTYLMKKMLNNISSQTFT